MSMLNVTMVLADQKDLDYYLYWATAYHSTLPFFQQQAQFLRDTIGISQWQVGGAGGWLGWGGEGRKGLCQL